MSYGSSGFSTSPYGGGDDESLDLSASMVGQSSLTASGLLSKPLSVVMLGSSSLAGESANTYVMTATLQGSGTLGIYLPQAQPQTGPKKRVSVKESGSFNETIHHYTIRKRGG